ncbi:MAG TPA: FtsX-like permease family protein [Thermoanaerobaculia bacterium]|jgi:putative ABC transport system permease protein|nr:FtsX-like permease family protein [Thermoanaerobaculia bacterium]
MKFLPLIWSNLKRKKLRTAFTLLSILVAFILFGYLSAIRMAFTAGVEMSGADRLMVTHKVSIIQPLPIAYNDRIAAVPGVREVTHANWFGGIYQDPKNFFPQMAVDAVTYMDLYPEMLLPAEQRKAWLADRQGAVVGRTTAQRFGWKVGDKIPIQGTIYRHPDGSNAWDFNLDGIYDGKEKSTDTSGFLFHYDYLKEATGGTTALVGWYIIRIDDPAHSADVARRTDSLFANSPYETKTQSEKALAQSFASQVGDIGKIMRIVLAAVFFTILLVAGNTMAQSVRERTSELAVLKTLGFGNGQVLALVLAESCLLAALGGALGLAIGWALITAGGDPTHGNLPVFYFPPPDVALGAGLTLLLGLVTGLLPAIQAMRLRIVDALRRV